MKLIPLTQGMFAKVDDEDYERINKYNWYFNNGYASRQTRERTKLKRVFMHRFVMGCEKGKVIDHINQDRLDNRKSNLRVCSQKQNVCNQKGRIPAKFKGVHNSMQNLKRYGWMAIITTKNKSLYLGTFKCPTLAALAYDRAAHEYHGEFACTNFGSKARK
jgi:hypothetical protein